MGEDVIEIPEASGVFTEDEMRALVLAAMPDADDGDGVTEEDIEAFVNWAVLTRVSEMLVQLAIDGELRVDVRGSDPDKYGWYKPEEKEEDGNLP